VKAEEEDLQPTVRNVATQEFSLELLAATALHFCNSDPQHRDMEFAVKRALWFLEECAKGLQDRRTGVAHWQQIERRLEERGWQIKDHVSYAEGIKFLTGQSRLDRAQARYEEVIKQNVLGRKPLSSAELNAELKKKEKEGFIVQELLFLQGMFFEPRSKKRDVKKA
jgi:hypothetical protein